MEAPFTEQLRAVAPAELDIDEIVRQWRALAPPYQIDTWCLPLPPWGHRSYDEGGEEAWWQVKRELAATPRDRPICIYFHVPFCRSKCGYCDCYSFKLGAHQEDHIETYVDMLEHELWLWAQEGNLRHRPVTSVHLGGGTPTFLGVGPMRRLMERCAELFAVSPATEWALETTIIDLTPEMQELLHGLGFRRVHFGIESMEDRVRLGIGRRKTAREAMDRISEMLDRGWVVSVDLVCGLPMQTLGGFLGGISDLIALGVDGFSIYELLVYPQNRRWAASWGLMPRNLDNFVMYQAGAGLMDAHGFKMNLFNHWANERDQNVYFTYPTRGEDLVAVGTIADGVVGDYHYRHPQYLRYCTEIADDFPGLEGGLRRTPLESAIYPLTTALMAGTISADQAAKLDGLTGTGGVPLIGEWLERRLVTRAPDGSLGLTANGSWFNGNLARQLSAAWIGAAAVPAAPMALPMLATGGPVGGGR